MIVAAIDKIVKWTQENVCEGLQFKNPTTDETAKDYEYELVTPIAIPMYISSDAIPSVCIQLLTGDVVGDDTILKFRFNFSTWNPGNHNQDNITKVGDNQYERSILKGPFKSNYEGWRDVWNFTDKTLNKLKTTQSIENMDINHDTIKFGIYTEQDSVVMTYPYYFSWIEVEMTIHMKLSTYEINNLL